MNSITRAQLEQVVLLCDDTDKHLGIVSWRRHWKIHRVHFAEDVYEVLGISKPTIRPPWFSLDNAFTLLGYPVYRDIVSFPLAERFYLSGNSFTIACYSNGERWRYVIQAVAYASKGVLG